MDAAGGGDKGEGATDTVEGAKGAGLREVTSGDNGHIQSVSDVGEGGEGRAQDCGIVLGSGRQEQVEGISWAV